MELELFETEDGSHSIYIPTLNERYHSFHGAINESKHIYIEAGLRNVQALNEKATILEIGFGTGLNAYLTLLELSKKKQTINYTTLEPFPLSKELYSQLNYLKILAKTENEKKKFLSLHSCEWNKKIAITEDFTFYKLKKTLQEFETKEKYNLIYFDAFAPEIQPFMWTKEMFEKIFFLMKPAAILITYCAKGVLKRTLKEVGFTIESLPGPIGKREILRAVK